MGRLLQQQPAIEWHDCNGYSVMLKLVCSVKRDNQATAQTEFVAALRESAKFPLPCFCIAESGRNLNGLGHFKTLFDNKITLRFILEKVDLFFPSLEFQKNCLLQSFAGIVRKFEVESIQQAGSHPVPNQQASWNISSVFEQDRCLQPLRVNRTTGSCQS